MHQRFLMRIVAIVLGGSCMLACGEGAEPPAGQRPEETLRAPAVGIRQIIDEPARFDGQTVRLVAEVAEVVAPRAFVLEDGGLFTGGEIVVLTREPARPMGVPVVQDEQVIVIGTVHALADARRMLGVIDPRVEAAVADDVVVIAQHVRRPRG